MSRRNETILVLLILLLAAGLRMGWPGWTEFKADEGRLLTLALQTSGGERFAIRGLGSSVGFPNFPMSVWVYALPLLVWRHVYAATLFTGLLNTLAVAVCYGFVRRYWGVQAALVAALMFATSPWAVIFSRKIWAQNLLSLFVLGWVIGAVWAFVEKRPKFILLHFLCLAVAVQIHLSAIVLVPATLFLLLFFYRRVNWRLAGWGVVVGLATAVPFFYYLWQNREQLERLSLVNRGWLLSSESLRYTAMITLGYDIHSLAGPEQFELFLQQIPWMGWVYGVWGVLMLGGIGRWVVTVKDWRLPTAVRSIETGFIVVIWLLAAPLFFLIHNTPIFLHYFIVTLPSVYILAGAVAARWKWIGVVVGGTAVFQLYAVFTLLRFLSQHDTPGGFGTPIGYLLETVELAQTVMTTSGVSEIVLAGPGESPDMAEFPAIYQALLYDVPHRFVDVKQTALFPTNGAVVIAAAGEMAGVYGETAVSQQTVPLRQGEGALQVFVLPVNGAPTPDVILNPPVLLQNWVSFVGYDTLVWQENGTAVWQLYWHSGGNPDPNQYQFFVHLINHLGQRVAQADVPAFSPAQWHGVDTLVTQFVIQRPSTSESLHVGMYQYPSLDPIYLLDIAGNPYTDALEIEITTQEQ